MIEKIFMQRVSMLKFIYIAIIIGSFVGYVVSIDESLFKNKNGKDISARMPIEEEENQNKAAVENEEKEEKVLFSAKDDWQEVKPYHQLPPGLHIRINLETGKKEAKLLSENEQSKSLSVSYAEMDDSGNKEVGETPVEGQNDLFRENLIEALKNIKNEDPEKESTVESKSIKKKFRSYDTLKAEFEGLHINIESDAEILKRLIKEYGETDDDVRLSILEDLDFLIHQIDNAVNFVGMEGIAKVIKPGLNSTNPEIRKGIMKLLGSSSQSNPKVQIAVFEQGLLNHVLRVVAREKDVSISSKAVFALSCMVRGFPYGQQKLIESGGLHTLREVFRKQDWHGFTLQLKVVSLIQDLLEERVNAEGERANQLGKPDLIQSLVEGEWCTAVSSLLAGVSFDKRGMREDLSAALGKEVPLRPDHDMVDKIISTMTLLVPSCDHNFFPFVSFLRSLRETYSDLAYKEKQQGEDGFEFFQSIANQIQFLLMKINRKEEL